MPLTDLMAKQALPEEKTYSMGDGNGLSLEIRPNGKKYWIIRYWQGGKERRTSVGAYPAVSLKQAREKNAELRKSLEAGKPVGFGNETFASVAKEWLKVRMEPTNAASYLESINQRLNNYILPAIGNLKLEAITSGVILQLCRKIEQRGIVETASRVKQVIGAVFKYAISTDRISTDPTLALYGALTSKRRKHHATITDPVKIGLLMRHIDAYPYPLLRCVMKFSALVFCRPGEVRHAEWTEINLEAGEWKIPAEKMKMKRPHIVPLASQAVDLLRFLYGFTGSGRWAFPSPRASNSPMSESAVR